MKQGVGPPEGAHGKAGSAGSSDQPRAGHRTEATSDRGNDFGDLLDLLWSRPPDVVWAPAGKLAPGYRRAERLLLLPSSSRPSFSVSLGSRRGAMGCVTAYGRLRSPRRRAERAAAGLGLFVGLAQRPRRVIEVGLLNSPESPDAPAQLLSCHLARLLGVPSVVIGCSAGTPPYRKPVLQIFDGRGRPLGYAKVGWNSWSRAAVRREADGLARMATGGNDLAPLRVPKLLSLHEWSGLQIVVSSPLPTGVRRVAESAPLPSVEVFRRLTGQSVRVQRLDASAWWTELRHRVAQSLPADESKARLVEILEATAQAAGATELSFGMSHGDLSPWNLAVHDGHTYAWDFESSSPAAPVGLDTLHFGFQAAFVAQGRSVAVSETRARQRAAGVLTELGAPESAHRLLSHLHLLDLAVRHEEARAATGTGDARFANEVFALLASRLPARDQSLETALERRPA
jgi:hypothetical protein